MECIYCGGKTQITNSRNQSKLNQKWRRRACLDCKAIFTTLEAIDFGTSLSVKLKSGRLEPFERDKLFISILNACGHRKDATKVASALTATVISKLTPKVKQATLNSVEITNTTELTLKRFDKVAATYYAAYHISK